jgi:hypothetical protein
MSAVEITVYVMIAVLLLGVRLWMWREDKREHAAWLEKMKDPEFSKRYYDSRASDDWEDWGYFDGR